MLDRTAQAAASPPIRCALMTPGGAAAASPDVQGLVDLILARYHETHRREFPEAIRLARTLCQLLPKESENLGLLALMLLHDSRREARTDKQGRLILLEEQDRSLWDREQIREGQQLVRQALGMRSPGPYQLQGAIAAVHSHAETAAETDWREIAALYRELLRISPSPVVALNHAVAVAMSEGLERGLALVEQAGKAGELRDYHLFYAARADLLRRLGRRAEAGSAYEEALRLATNGTEKEFLKRRLEELRNAI